MPIEDLYQVGVIGLIKAQKNYNGNYNSKFSTYAFDYIKGEILSYIRKENPIKVSKDYFRLRKEYEIALDKLTSKLNREVSKEEVCSFLGIDECLINEVLSSTDSILSLDNLENESLYNFIGEDSWEEIDDNILLRELINSLDEEEQRIINCRYFLDYTQEQTAAILGLSQIGVSRREKKTIQKLQKKVML